MYERFTDRARKVMQLANQEAQRLNHEYLGTEHVLLGLVKEGSGVAAWVLANLNVDLGAIRREAEKIVQSGPDMVTMGKMPQTPSTKKVIEYAIEEARNLNHNYVGTEHLLLGLLREQKGVAAQVLMNLGLKLEDVREEVLNLLGHGSENEEKPMSEWIDGPPTEPLRCDCEFESSTRRYTYDIAEIKPDGTCMGKTADGYLFPLKPIVRHFPIPDPPQVFKPPRRFKFCLTSQPDIKGDGVMFDFHKVFYRFFSNGRITKSNMESLQDDYFTFDWIDNAS